MCACPQRSDNYPLEVEEAYESVGAMTLQGEVVALATNVVAQQIELFIGIAEDDAYSLRKVTIIILLEYVCKEY